LELGGRAGRCGRRGTLSGLGPRAQALAGGLAPSGLFGGEHLLRLLLRLPALLPTGGLAPAALASIEAGLAHFARFLARCQARPPARPRA